MPENNKSAKIKQTMGHGLVGLVGLGATAAVGWYCAFDPSAQEAIGTVERSNYDMNVILGILSSCLVTLPIGITSTIAALGNGIELRRRDNSYEPITLEQYFLS